MWSTKKERDYVISRFIDRISDAALVLKGSGMDKQHAELQALGNKIANEMFNTEIKKLI